MPQPADYPWLLAALFFGYFCGSIPFGFLVTRFAGIGDIREVGSGNIGATNVLRTGRRFLAGLTLAFDVLKGTLAVLAADVTFDRNHAIMAGLGACLGHVFPIWLRFKGGKGVATYIGVLAGLYWPAAVAFGAFWLAAAALSRISSLSALVASLATPFVLFLMGRWYESVLFALLTILLWAKHAPNIRRLLEGTEPKIGARA
jgi:glycerol-3-phosphate acyltransferase PlsY